MNLCIPNHRRGHRFVIEEEVEVVILMYRCILRPFSGNRWLHGFPAGCRQGRFGQFVLEILKEIRIGEWSQGWDTLVHRPVRRYGLGVPVVGDFFW